MNAETFTGFFFNLQLLFLQRAKNKIQLLAEVWALASAFCVNIFVCGITFVFNYCIVFYHVSYFCDLMCILCVFYVYFMCAAIGVIINDNDSVFLLVSSSFRQVTQKS